MTTEPADDVARMVEMFATNCANVSADMVRSIAMMMEIGIESSHRQALLRARESMLEAAAALKVAAEAAGSNDEEVLHV